MKKIMIVDPFSTGHHIEYATHVINSAASVELNVILVSNANMISKVKKNVSKSINLEMPNSDNFIIQEYYKIIYLRKVLSLAKEMDADIVHFLYLDRFVRAFSLFGLKKNIKYFATCHWLYMLPDFSNSIFGHLVALIERVCLKLMVHKGWKVITHSKLGSERLFGTCDNVLDYPITTLSKPKPTQLEQFKVQLGLNDSDELILCFGGTRKDKGADFAIRVLSQLPKKYHLLIAGKEECIKYSDLKALGESYEVTERLHLIEGFISDELSSVLFYSSDIIFTPYSKTFSGQSGPLTIGASLGKAIVTADALILRETVEKYCLGNVFYAGDLISAVNAFSTLNKESDSNKYNDFISEHSVDRFLNSQRQLYCE